MNTAEIPTFDLAGIPAFYEAESQAGRNVAVDIPEGMRYSRRTERRRMLHLLHVSNAAQHLGRLPRRRETVHCVMKGNFHAWDLVPAVIQLASPAIVDELHVATLGFNRGNAQELLDLHDEGKVRRVSFIASCYFKSTSGDEFAHMHEGLTARGQRCVAVRSHAKVILFALSDGRRLVIESSANLRSCHNVEQFSLTNDAGLYRFHRKWTEHLIRGAK